MPRAAEPPRAWQRMLSGRRLDLLNPSPLDIEVEDIAHGLARVARWNGQTKGDHAFSVAQHCVLVEELAVLLDAPTPLDEIVRTGKVPAQVLLDQYHGEWGGDISRVYEQSF